MIESLMRVSIIDDKRKLNSPSGGISPKKPEFYPNKVSRLISRREGLLKISSKKSPN
jgi:hypothetical protein